MKSRGSVEANLFFTIVAITWRQRQIPKMTMALLTLTDDKVLRGMVQGPYYFSVYDFINFVCGKDLKATYGRTAFGRLTAQSSEVAEIDKLYLKLPGSDARKVPGLHPCMSINGLERLMLQMAEVDAGLLSQYRKIVEDVFSRFRGGEWWSLVKEVPMDQTCRAALAQEPVTGKRRKIEELEIEEPEIEELELRAKFSERITDVQGQRIRNVRAFIETMSLLDAEWKRDARLVRQTKELLQDAVFNRRFD